MYCRPMINEDEDYDDDHIIVVIIMLCVNVIYISKLNKV